MSAGAHCADPGGRPRERTSQPRACPQARGLLTGTPIASPRTTLAACPWPPALPGSRCPWGEVQALRLASQAGRAHALPPGAGTVQTGKGLRAWAVETERGSNPNATLLLEMAGKPPPKPKSLQGFPWTVSSAKSPASSPSATGTPPQSSGLSSGVPSSTKLAQTPGAWSAAPLGAPSPALTMGVCPLAQVQVFGIGDARSPGRGGRLGGWGGGLLQGSRSESVLRGTGRDRWVEE